MTYIGTKRHPRQSARVLAVRKGSSFMPFELQGLPQSLRRAGWKVKIFDRERLEPPHVTIMRKSNVWRLSLRDGSFIDQGGQWSQIHTQVRRLIEAEWDTLCAEWDALYPGNPVLRENDG